MKKEIWKEIPGYKGLYKVSNLGNVKALPRKNKDGVLVGEHLIYPHFKTGSYYHFCILKNKNGETKAEGLPRLVAKTFKKQSIKGRSILKKDGLCYNNCADNLIVSKFKNPKAKA
jgi:hypothetical protein